MANSNQTQTNKVKQKNSYQTKNSEEKKEIKLRKVSMGCSPPIGRKTNTPGSKSTSEEEF